MIKPSACGYEAARCCGVGGCDRRLVVVIEGWWFKYGLSLNHFFFLLSSLASVNRGELTNGPFYLTILTSEPLLIMVLSAVLL